MCQGMSRVDVVSGEQSGDEQLREPEACDSKVQEMFLGGSPNILHRTRSLWMLHTGDTLDDSADLAMPNEVEQFNLALRSVTVGKLELQQLIQDRGCCP